MGRNPLEFAAFTKRGIPPRSAVSVMPSAV
jgi:hypothetical protein